MESLRVVESHSRDSNDGDQVAIHLWGNGVTKDGVHAATSSSDMVERIKNAISTTLLPAGFPHSVRPEYATYQLWDSVQGMSSYLRSVLTTRSILAGAGVGSAESTAYAAALVWVFRDGLGMIGSLLFAYKYAGTFEVYIKEWRYLADILNNIGLTLDLLCADFPRYYLPMTSVSTVCKSCCGLIAGATKARISAHFAKPGHLADVTAKESTQETAVALCGLVLGMVLARLIGNDDTSVWVTFLVLLAVHQYSNYHLVKVLVFSNLNPQRSLIIVEQTYSRFEAHCRANPNKEVGSGVVPLPSPREVAMLEGFLRPIYLSFFGPVMGGSVQDIVEAVQFVVVNRSGQFMNSAGLSVQPTRRSEALCPPAGDTDRQYERLAHCNVCAYFARLCEAWASEEYIIGVNRNGRVMVAFKQGVSPSSIVKAYLVGYYVYRSLDAKLALYAANDESRHACLSEMYTFLICRLAREALLWYAALQLPSRNTEKSVQSAEDAWDMLDVTALSLGDHRFRVLEQEDKKHQ